jgi:hypothetical protein
MIELPGVQKIKVNKRVNPKINIIVKPKVGKTEMISGLDNCLLYLI